MNKWFKSTIAASLLLVIAACGNGAPDEVAPDTAVVNGVSRIDRDAGTANLNVSALDADGAAVEGSISAVRATVNASTASGSSLDVLQNLSVDATVCEQIIVRGQITGIISLDGSGSMISTDPLALRAEASKQFVSGISANDELAIASFMGGHGAPDYYVIHQDFTSDKALLEDGIDEATLASGQTPLWTSSRTLIENELDGNELNKVLLVMTDGADTGQGGTLYTDVAEAAVAADVRVYFVGLGNPGSLNESNMVEITNDTGGLYARTEDVAELEELFTNVRQSATASGEICLTFSPTPVAAGTVVEGTVIMTIAGRDYEADYRFEF